jgi:hypothetical protein
MTQGTGTNCDNVTVRRRAIGNSARLRRRARSNGYPIRLRFARSNASSVCLNASFACLNASFARLNASFDYLNASFPCLNASFGVFIPLIVQEKASFRALGIGNRITGRSRML